MGVVEIVNDGVELRKILGDVLVPVCVGFNVGIFDGTIVGLFDGIAVAHVVQHIFSTESKEQR